jgi:small subunit ribosomal protein S6
MQASSEGVASILAAANRATSCSGAVRRPDRRVTSRRGRFRPKEVIRTNEYEILLMLHPDAEEGRQGEVVDRVRQTIEARGGTWNGVDDWGKRKLAYEIDHQADAFYQLLSFDSEPEALDEVTRVLAITDGVMRFMPTRRPQESHGRERADAAA